ncbi:MAG: transposase [Xanthomonadales bacterium]|nr:transposase [Xanthomonadales bacterium]
MSSPKLLTGRESRPGHFYVVTTVVSRRAALFLDPALARLAADAMRTGEAESLAWVVMPDHVHWLLRVGATPLSRCVQAFKSRAARAINAARGTSGPVWQAGFYDHRLRHEEDLHAQARYIVANPLRRGLVGKIEDYPHWWCQWVSCSDDLCA